jgi:elongation factor G
MNAPITNRPILSAAFTAQADNDAKPLLEALTKIATEDSNIEVSAEPSKEMAVVATMSVAHLLEIGDRLLNEFGLQVNISDLKVRYVEAIRRRGEGEGKYIRQTGGSGNYGHCWLRVEPNGPGKGYEFVNDIEDRVVPKEYVEPIDQGVRDAMELGILAAFPMVDVKVTLFNGSYHEVDSNEMAFKFAGSIAFKEAARKAFPVLLEPVMAVEITVREEHMGATIGEINACRGRIEGMEHRAGSQIIKALVPLSELLGSRSRWLLEFPMVFAGYEEVPHRGGFDGMEPAPAIRPKVPNQGSGSVALRQESETN